MQDAYVAAQELLDRVVRPEYADVVISSCQEFPTAWVFGYNTRRFVQDMDLLASLVGNGPVVVPKSGEPPYLGASGAPIENQIQPR